MPTEVIHTIGTGGDYAALESWEAAQARNLVALDEIAIAEVLDQEVVDSNLGMGSAWTTSATNRIIIRPVAGAEFNGVPRAVRGSGAKLKFTATTGNALQVESKNITIQEMEIEVATSGTALLMQSGNVVDRCSISHLSADSASNTILAGNGRQSVIQNSFIKTTGRGIETRAGSVDAKIYNCTVIGSGTATYGILTDSSATVTNCVVAGFAIEDIFGTPIGANNFTEDGSIGSTVSTMDGVDFVSPSTGDYRPASGGALDGAGTDLSAFFTDDITGATRTQWDIGAFGIVGGGSTTVGADSLSHSVTIDNITLTQANVLAVQGVTHGQALDNVTLTQAHTLAANSLAQSQSIDNATLTQANAIVPNSMTQGQSLDAITLTQAHVLVPNGMTQGQSIDAITLLAAGTLDVQSLAHSQTIDEALLTVAGVLSVQGITQAQALEALELVQMHVLAPNGITQGQSVDNATLSAAAQALALDDVSQSQGLDSTTLTQYHVLAVDGLTQAQAIDVCLFGGLVIGELNGQIVIYAAYRGSVYAIPALSGTIH
jgi:hypothetical protein